MASESHSESDAMFLFRSQAELCTGRSCLLTALAQPMVQCCERGLGTRPDAQDKSTLHHQQRRRSQADYSCCISLIELELRWTLCELGAASTEHAADVHDTRAHLACADEVRVSEGCG